MANSEVAYDVTSQRFHGCPQGSYLQKDRNEFRASMCPFSRGNVHIILPPPSPIMSEEKETQHEVSVS